MNTQSTKLNRSDETSDQGIAIWSAGHAEVHAPSRSGGILSLLAGAFGSGGVMHRDSPQSLLSATYFPELLSALGGQALTAHWDCSVRKRL